MWNGESQRISVTLVTWSLHKITFAKGIMPHVPWCISTKKTMEAP